MLSRCCGAIRQKTLTHSSGALLQLDTKATAFLSKGFVTAQRNYHIGRPQASTINNLNAFLRKPNVTALCLSSNSLVRFKSTNSPLAIPEPPVIPTPVAPAVPTDLLEVGGGVVGKAVEPAFETLGLGGWTPAGMVQSLMEYCHVACDVPWWGTILIGTVIVRTIIFPLVIKAQQNAAKMSNNMPQMQVLQLKMTEARQSGNALESARYAQEMASFMKEKGLNPLKNMLVPLAQAPLFISFFIGLRQMANAPVESMREGGLFWFTDLTLPDQFYLLPLLTSATLYLTIELGTDSAKLSAHNMQTMRYVLRALPVVIFPFTINFPGAILCYWAFSNFFSLIQVGVLKVPAVRDYFNIERPVHHPPEALPIKKKKFVEGFKDSWQNMKLTQELAERERIDAIQFERAGSGPLVKTYKFDPTKMPTVQSSTTVQAKKR